MLRSLLPSSVGFSLEVADGEGQVRMSPAQFDQVLLNLAVNARDALGGEGALAVRLADVDDSVVVEVADTGAGMDAATAERCFEPFFTTKGGMKGTGLGLATVHSVVTGAGGDVTVESTPGKGTTFTVRLPRVAAPAAAEPEAGKPGAAVGSERILVVENEDGLRRVVVEVLRGSGYVVTPASHGLAALDILEREAHDLVITDVVMPRMGGAELAERMAERQPGLPVLFMTGYVDQSSRESLKGAAVLVKPFLVDDLVNKVREVLDGAYGSKR
jgi:CheY-like chemotaxis protein